MGEPLGPGVVQTDVVGGPAGAEGVTAGGQLTDEVGQRLDAWIATGLGFIKEWEHRFEPGLPLYVGMARGQMRVHLSEHTGDARPGTLVYFTVDDLDAVAPALGVTAINDMPWGRDLEVLDRDGNRLRIGSSS